MQIDRFFPGLVLGVMLVLAAGPARAHKVNIFAYSEGDTIFTESYFPDGRKVQGGKVEVYDSAGAKLLEGVTDKEGIFNFKTPKKDDFKIVLIATMGHKNSFLIGADEIEAVASGNQSSPPAVVSNPTKEIARDEAIQKEIDPTQAEVTEESSKKKNRRRMEPPKESNAVAILAGLGFIFGLTSLVLHFTKKDGTKS